jgi:iron(III) transport system substrate-binding protein
VRRVQAGLAGALLLVLAACGGGGETDEGVAPSPTGEAPGDEALIEAAQAEGSLTWYGGSSETGLTGTAEAFSERYGIEVNFTRLVTAQIAERFGAEVTGGNVQADVMSTVNPLFFEDQLAQGNLIELTDDEVPGVGEWEEQYLSESGAAAVIGIAPYTVAWNTDVVPDFQPESWEDLIDPAVEGEIILADPRASAAWAQVWSAVLNDPELGEDYITQFSGQGFRQIVESAGPGTQLLAAGEGGMIFATTSSQVTPLADQGAPLEQFFLADPAPVSFIYAGIPADAPHPNAARLFLQWLLTEEGQTAYNISEFQASPLGDLEGLVPVPEGLIPPDPEQATADLPRVVELLGL